MTEITPRKMADSGLTWLGLLPSDWRRVPLWTLYRRVKRTGFKGEQLLSIYRDYGVVPKASRDDNFNNASDDLSLYQLVEPGDLAINKMKAWQGSVAISKYRGIASPAYFIFTALHGENPRFLHYLFRSLQFTAFYLSISKGIRPNQWDLEPQDHSRAVVPLPSPSEQAAIAAFLDRETGKIDALVEEQRRLIELLKEKHQASISHVVTKGLNTNTKMKPSGVEWLGDVPEHWGVMACRHLIAAIEQGWSPECENRQAEPEEWGVLKAGCANGALFREEENKVLPKTLDPIPRLEVQVGDVVMSRANGSADNVGATAYVDKVRPRLMLSDKTFRLLPSARMRPQFLALLLGSRALRYQIERSISGADGLANNLPQSALRAFIGLAPPLEEQDAIVKQVEVIAEDLETLGSAAEQAVALLLERRAALISAAVTGKIDLRDNSDAETIAA